MRRYLSFLPVLAALCLAAGSVPGGAEQDTAFEGRIPADQTPDDSTVAARRIHALHWASGADVVLIPAEGRFADMVGELRRFWLSVADLELLLELALRQEGLLLAGAQVYWNPLRPPYDRIFEIQLLDAETGLSGPKTAWHTLVGDERLVAVALPLSLARQLMRAASPWFDPPVVRYRSGDAAHLPDDWPNGSPEGGTEDFGEAVSVGDEQNLVQQWREQGWETALQVGGASGYVRELSVRPKAWLGRASVHGWLMGLLAMLLAGLLSGGLFRLRLRMSSR